MTRRILDTGSTSRQHSTPLGTHIASAFLLTLALGAWQTAPAQTCSVTDADCDGIPDQLERTLLATFRPFFKFSRDHALRPFVRPMSAPTCAVEKSMGHRTRVKKFL